MLTRYKFEIAGDSRRLFHLIEVCLYDLSAAITDLTYATLRPS